MIIISSWILLDKQKNPTPLVFRFLINPIETKLYVLYCNDLKTLIGDIQEGEILMRIKINKDDNIHKRENRTLSKSMNFLDEI